MTKYIEGTHGTTPGMLSAVSALRWTAVFALWLTGCFTEEPPPSAGTTTGPSCVEGAIGCECYGNGTCDAGLECDAGAQLCIPSGCTPGELACRCDDDQLCTDALQCQQGVCVEPGPPPATDDGDSTTGPPPATDDGPATTTMTTDPDTTNGPGPTTDDSSSSTGVDLTTGGTVECDEGAPGPGCQPCIDCVDNEPTACESAYDTCQGITGCITAAMCLRDCGLTGICFDDCCDGLGMDATNAAFNLTFCRTDNCPSTCGPYEFPTSCP